ncbi:MAG: ribonuclease H-like YkuK family protein [Halanaerobiaceae bacterium]
MKFTSPTDGLLNLKEIYTAIINFVKIDPESQYRLIVGTDSHPGLEEVVFVTAIVIYRVGRGGRFFYHKEKVGLNVDLKVRIFHEVSRSLKIASKLTDIIADKEKYTENMEIEIHIDVGENGPTSDIIREVVGMVIGSGYEAMIKPDSYAASSVADKYTK